MRWGILSTAEITGKVAPALQTANDSQLVAIASRALDKAQEWADKHCPGAKAYGSYEELLKDDNVDAVYIPLPSGVRNEWVKKAAEAKKHVYVEKPFFGDVDELVATCKKHNVQFMDGTMWLHSERTKKVAAMMRDGEIGTVRRVTSAFTFAAPSQEWIDGGNGRTDKAREPFGCFGDQGWYPVSAILFAFDDELPERVQMTHVVKNKIDTIVACSGMLFFSNNRVASFDAGCLMAHRSWVEITGTDGLIRIDDLVGGDSRTGNFDAYFVPFVGSSRFTHGSKEGKDRVIETTPCDHVIKLVDDFIAAVHAGTDDKWPRRTATQHKVMCALFESAENDGKIVNVN